MHTATKESSMLYWYGIGPGDSLVHIGLGGLDPYRDSMMPSRPFFGSRHRASGVVRECDWRVIRALIDTALGRVNRNVEVIHEGCVRIRGGNALGNGLCLACRDARKLLRIQLTGCGLGRQAGLDARELLSVQVCRSRSAFDG